MKTLLFLFCLAAVTACAQNTSEKYAALRKIIRQTDADSSLFKVTLMGEDFTDESVDGELVGFYNGKEIQKISRVFFATLGKESRDYYWENDELIFVHVVAANFATKRDHIDYSNTTVSYVGSFYFNKGQLTDSKSTGKNNFVRDSNAIGSILVDEANEYKKKLHEKFVLGE